MFKNAILENIAKKIMIIIIIVSFFIEKRV